MRIHRNRVIISHILTRKINYSSKLEPSAGAVTLFAVISAYNLEVIYEKLMEHEKFFVCVFFPTGWRFCQVQFDKGSF